MDETPGAQPTIPMSPPAAPASGPTVPIATPPAAEARAPRATRGWGWGPVIGTVAGVVLVVAPFLSWSTVSLQVRRATLARRLGRGAISLRGIRIPDGHVVLGLGVALVALALLAWLGRRVALRLHSAVLALAAGAVALAVSIGYLTVRTGPGEGGRLGQALGRALSVSKGAGLWVALIGGVLAVLAAAIELVPRLGQDPAEAAQ
ncbi:MAG TPA: hypothetical protein VJO72_13000 [Candidatus Dormibacteraeota bacterium]|nr:hypothetical protein [Candidatus Dormibacteraeota bacterium]